MSDFDGAAIPIEIASSIDAQAVHLILTDRAHAGRPLLLVRRPKRDIDLLLQVVLRQRSPADRLKVVGRNIRLFATCTSGKAQTRQSLGESKIRGILSLR